MKNLNYPDEVTSLIKIREDASPKMLWDPCRKKWLQATPEEWVRQHALSYLSMLGYSFELMKTESGLRTGFKEKRSDAIVFVNATPFILVECKAPTVSIDQKVFNQAFNYNQTLNAKFLYLTNGMQHIYWDVAQGKAINKLPIANDLDP